MRTLFPAHTRDRGRHQQLHDQPATIQLVESLPLDIHDQEAWRHLAEGRPRPSERGTRKGEGARFGGRTRRYHGWHAREQGEDALGRGLTDPPLWGLAPTVARTSLRGSTLPPA